MLSDQPRYDAVQDQRRQVDQRPERPADAICEAISDAVGESLAQGQFEKFLRARGWALVHIGDGTCPEAPAQWLHDGLDMTESGWYDPVGRLEELWRQAWVQGNQAGRTGA